QELTPDFIASSDYRTSCLFAIAWNICRSRLPAEVMGDWLEFNQKNQLPRMDGGIGTSATAGEVSLSLGETEILFNDMELAPACGMMGQNYSRGVHHERQPHKFAVQWILRRNQGASAGGHFYISSYGVKIINTTDTLTAWQPWHWHATSLADYDPEDLYP
ncbi:hypothetical protein C8Q74DRAFT_1172087, partial [Fomes fomentarius]